MIEIQHNFDVRKFKWLWAKYVIGFNDRYHCTNSIRGKYSARFSKLNPSFSAQPRIAMDEHPLDSFRAIYICGVSTLGYSKHLNYAHNVHAVIVPEAGRVNHWAFEQWEMSVSNGTFVPIPASVEQLPPQYSGLPPEYTTCRIFRWAASYFS